MKKLYVHDIAQSISCPRLKKISIVVLYQDGTLLYVLIVRNKDPVLSD